MDDIEKAFKLAGQVWRWFNTSSPITQFSVGICGMVAGMMGLFAAFVSWARGPQGQQIYELIHADVMETKDQVKVIAKDVGELKVSVGRFDERMDGFKSELNILRLCGDQAVANLKSAHRKGC